MDSPNDSPLLANPQADTMIPIALIEALLIAAGMAYYFLT